MSGCLCHFLYKNMYSVQRISLPTRAIVILNVLAQNPFFKNSLAGASGQVLVSIPGFDSYFPLNIFTENVFVSEIYPK